MDDRVSRLEARVEALLERVQALERRLGAFEAQGAAAGAARRPEAVPASADDRLQPLFPGGVDATRVLTLVGRTLLVLAGAFFLRALTEAGTLTPPVGVAIGLAYSLVWLVAADRAATRHLRLSTMFHGFAFSSIALPLLVEATSRFKLFEAKTSAACVAAFAALSLFVAVRRRLQDLAWITSLGVLVAAIALCFTTGHLAPYAAVLVLLGGATLWLGYVLDWFYLRWPVAIVTNLLVLVLGGRALGHGGIDSPTGALAVQILLLATYLGSVATRTLLLDRDVVPFEVAQSVAVIVFGLGGAAWVTSRSGSGGPVLGVASLLLGAGCYAVAVAFIGRRAGRLKNFYFYTSAALVFAVTGTALLLPPRLLALILTGLALFALAVGRRSARKTFNVHGTIYLLAAAIVSGLVLHEAHGLGLPLAPAHDLPWARLVVLAGCIVGVFLLSAGKGSETAPPLSRVPRLLLLVLAVTGVAGVLADVLTPFVSGLLGGASAGAAVAVRTVLLVLATLGLAWAAGRRGFVEGSWLVYPLLVVVGIQILSHGLRTSRPVTLFLTFGAYGAALILAPRWRKRAAKHSPN